MLVGLNLVRMVFAASLLRVYNAAELDEMSQRLDDLIAKMNGIDDTLGKLSRQVMLQQLSTEESIRSTGASGIKAGRLDHQGTKPYYANTYTGPKVMAVHDHANSNRTIGLGEFAASINGVEFRTRHNDYILVKSATAIFDNIIPYEAISEITYPPVPESVSNQATIEDQIIEMREYFKAWTTQNKTHRDYTNNFKPVLCYLETLWTTPDSDQVEESFLSDRHHLDAGTWHELQEKIMFSAYTGRKSRLENFAYLPTMITRIEDNKPVIAQWNYRILCHPLSNDLPTGQLKIIDDLHSRISYSRDMKKHYESRAARFKVVPDVDWVDQRINNDFLDKLMNQVPGMNGYDSNLEDPGTDSAIAKKFGDSGTPLNAAYYHRWFFGPKDAMGVPYQHRAYNDENIFMALTTQEKVAAQQVTHCHTNSQCSTTVQRWSYAIPLEIIYLTPLQAWNPHHIQFEFGDEKSATDGLTPETAHDTANMRRYYRTPAEFYGSTNDANADEADTSDGFNYIKDGEQHPKPVVASGVSIHTKDIPGIGQVRIRYPILPIHQEGNVIWKEVDALKDIVLNPDSKYANLLYRDKWESLADVKVELELRAKLNDVPPSEHKHRLVVSLADIKRALADYSFRFYATTDASLGHTHFLQMARTQRETTFKFVTCDGENSCLDGHRQYIHLPNDLIA